MLKFLKKNSYISIGLMLFALFFGAGNLIFPAFLGQNAGSNLSVAMIGFIIMGVGLPLLGVLVMGYSGAQDLLDLSSRAGKGFGITFTTLLYLTIGPFFAIPRTGTTTFELGLSSFIAPENTVIAQAIFLAIFMGITLWLSLTPNKLVDRIGTIITPVLLVSMIILIIASLLNPMGSAQAPTEAYSTNSLAFTNGLMEGYNTMDALASLVFGIIVINSVKLYGAKTEKQIFSNTTKAAVIAALLLALVYVFISNIGTTSVSVLGLQKTGAGVLTGATTFYFGNVGKILLFVIVFLACLTTSVGLVTACATYFVRLYDKISYKTYVVGLSLFSFAVGNYGLAAIIQGAVPVLVLLYPLTMVLILLGFANNLFGGKKVVYASTALVTGAYSLYTTIASTFKLSVPAVDNFLVKVLPIQGDFSWINFAVLGFILGLVLSLVKKEN
ncbi:branched-chain amino acid transport system II carrier protein [Gemella morbillorum]|jgi:branched-chain amino acid transport system II carrier protein|uniref:branched-chain amino acid transport system II carrier protein n=1 Tax=Gemella morbillorum TaxID=29391 RepID=UPI002551731B|nr:branched-chain amino acid transport system II carrier protein [Gemella morbillorum]MDK8240029.1 branched-chain amino acid transport system II carrier protein [Gemella morbillorum]MDK8255682.1 branched-chain amino acid transport system II carrier protein [Gemella morbillorum]